MRRARRSVAALAALAALLGGAPPAAAESACPTPTRPLAEAAPSQDPEEGIGGTGFGGDDSGIGGTGIRGGEDGVGGTGIFGTVTRLAGLCVNGLEIRYGPDVEVWLAGTRGSAADLAIGQVVWAETSERGGALEARKIAVVRALTGPVTAVEAAARRLRVAGRSVEVPDAAIVFGAPPGSQPALSAFRTGDFVVVYGLRRADGRVVASRIDRAQALGTTAQPEPTRLADLLRAAPQVRRLSVEGYLEPSGPGARFRVDGLDVDAAEVTRAGALLEAGGPVWLNGLLAPDGTLRLEGATPRPSPEPAPPLAGGAGSPPGGGTPSTGRPAGGTDGRGDEGAPSALGAADTAWSEMGRPAGRADPAAGGRPDASRPAQGRDPAVVLEPPQRLDPPPTDAILPLEPHTAIRSDR